MHRLTPLLCAGAIATALPIAAPAAASMSESLPGDTWMIVSVKDFDDVRAKWEASVLKDAWDSQEMVGLREEFDSAMADASEEFLNETGVELNDLMGNFKGFTSLLLTNLRWDAEVDDIESDAILLAEMDAETRDTFRGTFDEMIDATIPADASKTADEFGGTRIYRIEFTEDLSGDMPDAMAPAGVDLSEERLIEYAFTDSHFVMGVDSDGAVRQALAAMQGGDSTLAYTESWRAVNRMKALDGDVNFWLDIPRLVNMGLANSDDEEGSRVARILGLEDIGPMGATATLNAESIDSWAGAGLNPQRAGLFKLLTALSSNPLDSAASVPADAFSYTSWTLDGETLFTNIMEIITEVQPGIGMTAEGYLQNIKAMVNYDIQNDLLANLKGEHFTYTRPLPADVQAEMDANPDLALVAGSGSVGVFLNWINGESAANALDGLMNTLTGDQFRLPLESTNSQGVRTWTMRQEPGMPPPPVRPVFGLSPEYLVITTSMAEMQDALRTAGASTAGASLADGAEFQRAVAAAKSPELVMFNFNSAQSLAVQLDNFRNILAMTGADLEPGAIPPGEWAERYFGSSYSTLSVAPESLSTTSQLFLKN